MTIQDIGILSGVLLGLAAFITALSNARKNNTDALSTSITNMETVVNTLVEERDRLKHEKEEDKKRTDTEIAELRATIEVLKQQRESDQKEIHDLHAMIGKNFVQEVIRIQAQALKSDK